MNTNDTNVGPGMIYDSPDEKEILKLERKNYAQAAQIRVLQSINAKLTHDRAIMFAALEEWERAFCNRGDTTSLHEWNKRLEKARQQGVEDQNRAWEKLVDTMQEYLAVWTYPDLIAAVHEAKHCFDRVERGRRTDLE